MAKAPCDACIKVRVLSLDFVNRRLTRVQGSIHNGQPIGTEETIHGLNTYVVGNRDTPRAIIVMYSDVFGLALPNNKIIADAYAKSGEYLVYMPDFFKGDPVPLKNVDTLIPVDAQKQSTFSKYTGLLTMLPAFVLWQGRHKFGPTDQVCVDFLRKLRRSTPTSRKIGMVGFCWGGRYALRAGKEENMIELEGKKVPLVDTVVALHPSNLSFPEDVENLIVPTSIGWGRDDEMVPIAQKAKVEEIHAKSKKAGREAPEMEHKVYEPGRHGFAVRGNPDDPVERKILESTEAQVLDWMKTHL